MIEWIKANDYSGDWDMLVSAELAPVKDEEEDSE
jgi:hypothetical protein